MKKIDFIGKTFIIVTLIVTFALYFRIFSIGRSESHSIQDGIYLIFNLFKSDTTLNKGNYVEFCIPDIQVSNFAVIKKLPLSNRCKFGAHPLVKQVVAIEGDKVSINSSGVIVNNKYINNSKPIFNNFKYNFCNNYELKSGEYLMMGTSKRSLDSRYFGIVNKQFILGRGYLLWAKH